MSSKKTVLLIPMLSCLAFAWGCIMSIPEPRSPAAKLYVDKCSSCHFLPHPKRHKYKEWGHYLESMQNRMKQRGMTLLTETETTTIMEYLEKHSR